MLRQTVSLELQDAWTITVLFMNSFWNASLNLKKTNHVQRNHSGLNDAVCLTAVVFFLLRFHWLHGAPFLQDTKDRCHICDQVGSLLNVFKLITVVFCFAITCTLQTRGVLWDTLWVIKIFWHTVQPNECRALFLATRENETSFYYYHHYRHYHFYIETFHANNQHF